MFQSHPEVVAAGKKALDTHGAGLSSVRFICGTQVSCLNLKCFITFHLNITITITPECIIQLKINLLRFNYWIFLFKRINVGMHYKPMSIQYHLLEINVSCVLIVFKLVNINPTQNVA